MYWTCAIAKLVLKKNVNAYCDIVVLFFMWDVPSYPTWFECSCADPVSLCNLQGMFHGKIFNLVASTANFAFFEWVQVRIDLYIPYFKTDQASFIAMIFSCIWTQWIFCVLRPISERLVIVAKGFLKLPNMLVLY